MNQLPTEEAGAIIPAAGSGVRMGTNRPKQFLDLGGRPVLIHSLSVLAAHPAIRSIVLCVSRSWLAEARRLLDRFLPEAHCNIILAQGGSSRQESVARGLAAMPPEIRTILVHDAARPLLSSSLIDLCLAGVRQHGAVIAAIPVKDTLKKVDAQGKIEETVDREGLWQAQTPQAMYRHLLEQAMRKAREDGFLGTDEASLLEWASIPVHVVTGTEENFKITRKNDLLLARKVIADLDGIRIGHGFDAHRLTPGRDLILGGVHIPWELGLEGHSDADVLTHALMDALLGALGEGDIGRHFPDSDQRFKNISSLALLEQVMTLVKEHRMAVLNIDLTLVCQRPRLAAHLPEMEANLATTCAISKQQVNIKATTTEQMGYTGRGEGISAHAVVLLGRKTVCV